MWSRSARADRNAPASGDAGAAGFTLLEALAALTILAAGIGALAGLTRQNVATTLYAERRVALIAALRKAYVALPARDEMAETQQGEVNGFSWRLDALPLMNAAGRWTPAAVRLRVGNGAGDTAEVDAVVLRKENKKPR